MKDRNFLYHLFILPVKGFLSRESQKLPVFCKWSPHDAIPDFGVKKIPVLSDGRFFIEISAPTVIDLGLKEYARYRQVVLLTECPLGLLAKTTVQRQRQGRPQI